MSSSSCPKNLHNLTIKHSLGIIQAVMISVMAVYMSQIKKIFKDHQDKYRVSSMNAAMNTQNMCFSSSSADAFAKFYKYMEIVFYSIIASAVYNIMFLAYEFKMSSGKTIPTMVYAPIAIMGIVAMGFSVDGFLKINAMKGQPVECQGITSKFKTFFILSMTTSVFQAALSMWVMADMYVKVTST